MDLKTFFDNFELMAEAPNGVQKLREMVLQLAVQGKLVPQDPTDEPASVLLDKSKMEKEYLVNAKLIRKINLPSIPDHKNLKKNLPLNWELDRLGNIAHLVTKGATPTTYGYQFQESGVKFVKVENVKNGQINHNGIMQFISEEAHEFQVRSQLEEGDVLFSIAGTIGETCVVKKENVPANTNQALAIIRGTETVFESGFLKIILDSFVSNEIKSRARGGAMNNVSLGDIKQLVVSWPPKDEQKRIVAKVDELMALCDELEARKQKVSQGCIRLNDSSIDKLLTAPEPKKFNKHWQRICGNFDLLYSKPENVAKLRQAILQLAVQGKLVPQNPNDEPASALLKKIQTEKERLAKAGKAKKSKPLEPLDPAEAPPWLPEGWWLERFGNIALVTGGVTKGRKLKGRKTALFPYLRVANVQRWKLDLERVKDIEIPLDELAKYKLEYGDILIAEGGDWDKVGRAAIWEDQLEDCLHQNHIFKARIYINEIEKRWIIMYLNSPAGRNYFAGASKQTTNLASINMTQLKTCVVPLPPEAEQKRIVAKVDELMALCDELEAGLLKSQTDSDRFMQAAVADILAA